MIAVTSSAAKKTVTQATSSGVRQGFDEGIPSSVPAVPTTPNNANIADQSRAKNATPHLFA